MNYYNINEFQRQEGQGINRYMARTFGWMFVGLMVTFGTAIATVYTGLYARLLNGGTIFIITIAELVLVSVLSAQVHKMQPETATMLFLLYAMLNGLVFSSYFIAYNLGTLTFAFLASAIYFGAMAIYGITTQRDLTGWGPKLFGALIALLVVSVLGLFLRFALMDLIICAGGLALFMALTAYDTQRIKALYYSTGGYGEMAEKMSIVGALGLYLDFINIFIRVVALMGRNRNNRR